MISPLPKGSWTNWGGISAHMTRPLGNWQSDWAIDMRCPPGTPVYAVADGYIPTNAGFGFSDNGRTVWGSRLTLELGPKSGIGRVFYTHLARNFAKGIYPGARVVEGQVLGWIGNPPYFGSHLHFGAEPPSNPERIAAGPTKALTEIDRLRARTGYYAWLNWSMGTGVWKRYGARNPKVRPDIPAKIPRAYWRRLALQLKPKKRKLQAFTGVAAEDEFGVCNRAEKKVIAKDGD